MADFSTLANIARPQMMGNAQSPIAGMFYGQQMGQYNNFLAQAAEEAKIKAAMEAMKAEEFAAGSAGRKAKSALETEVDTAKLEDFRANGREDMMRERAMKELKAAEPLLNAIAAAEDDNEVAEILKNAGQYGNTKIRGKDLSTLDPQKAKKLADFYMKGQTQTPAHRQKKELEETKGEYRLLDRQFKEAGANTRQERMIFARTELEKTKAKNPTAYSIAMDAANGDPIKALEFLAFLKVAPVLQAGANTTGQANAILPPDKQMPTPVPVPGVTPPTAESQPGGPAQAKTMEPKIGDVWQSGKDRKGKILGIRREGGKIKQLNVEGIGVVDYK